MKHTTHVNQFTLYHSPTATSCHATDAIDAITVIEYNSVVVQFLVWRQVTRECSHMCLFFELPTAIYTTTPCRIGVVQCDELDCTNSVSHRRKFRNSVCCFRYDGISVIRGGSFRNIWTGNYIFNRIVRWNLCSILIIRVRPAKRWNFCLGIKVTAMWRLKAPKSCL